MWASALERAGVQVVYGFIEWKTHAKMSMVVRREEQRLPHLLPSRHRQLPSGDGAHLHRPQLLHRRPARRHDVSHIFNYITGYIEPRGLELIAMSPIDLRDRLPR